ncbi:TraR/DksA family transcriptional regulator [Thermoflexus sp.]|uniref:TraR/DksA family transcriptional regulator n=1 Tax=Thermoflexus sp. TaxID=1969742 RepID=UPI002ADE1A48|nr:TraR/DksA C4-type zinc finger protein [Thermoflexus sp.]
MAVPFDRFRRVLEEERVRLKEELARLDARAPEGIGYHDHMADDATDVLDQTTRAALRRHLEIRLQEVEAAIQRMEEGTYGICQACGRPIDIARLKAIPFAALCLDCQSKRERGSGEAFR